LLLAVVCGCAATSPTAQNLPQTGRDEAQEIEPILETAGFQSLAASSPEQKKRLKSLPSMRLGYYVDEHGAANYWLADPDYCGCLFHGDEIAYKRYQMLEKDYETADNDRQALQAQRYGVAAGPLGPTSFAPGMGFGFGPVTGFVGGFGFSL
jgi:hypothetical protein